jgi:hypothetical protein
MPLSTVNLQNVINFASTHADLLPLTNVGGYTNEPALSLCNDALGLLITSPNDWKFNSADLPLLVTCPNKLDQMFAGACAFSLGATSQGWGIDLGSNNAITVSGGVVTVNMLETHRFNIGDTVYLNGVVMTVGTTSAYNSTFSDNGSVSGWSGGWVLTAASGKSISFAATAGQNNADAGGAPGLTNIGYATSAALLEMNNTSSPVNSRPCETYKELPFVSRIANPDKVSILNDFGNGIIKIRWNFVPGTTTWGLKLVYQKAAPLKVALTDLWSPFPDNYLPVIRQAVLTAMYRYLNSPQADTEWKKLQALINQTQGADDAETTSVRIAAENLMDTQYYVGW